MPWLRSLLLLGLPLVSTVLAQDDEGTAVTGNWEEVVESLSGESLRAALQGYVQQYREGVFEDGHNAIDAVRSDDPALAAALVDLAKQDAVVKDHLRKRQGTNNTTTSAVGSTSSQASVTPESSTSSEASSTPSSTIQSTTSSEPSSTQDPTTTSSTPSAESTPSTTTNSPSDTASGTTAVAPTTEQTTSVAQSTTQAPTTSAPSSRASNTRASTSTESATDVLVNPSGSIITSVPPLFTATVSDGETVVLTSPTPGHTYTTRDKDSRVLTITYTPGGGTVSQVHYSTTKLPNGSLSTITSFATVGATADATSDSSNAQASDDATLQSGAAVPSTWYAAEMALVIGAAIGVAAIAL